MVVDSHICTRECTECTRCKRAFDKSVGPPRRRLRALKFLFVWALGECLPPAVASLWVASCADQTSVLVDKREVGLTNRACECVRPAEENYTVYIYRPASEVCQYTHNKIRKIEAFGRFRRLKKNYRVTSIAYRIRFHISFIFFCSIRHILCFICVSILYLSDTISIDA